MASLAEIIHRIQRVRARGKIVHLTPYTAGIVEEALLKVFAPPPSPPKLSTDQLPYRIEEWTADGQHMVAVHAALSEHAAALAAWSALTQSRPCRAWWNRSYTEGSPRQAPPSRVMARVARQSVPCWST